MFLGEYRGIGLQTSKSFCLGHKQDIIICHCMTYLRKKTSIPLASWSSNVHIGYLEGFAYLNGSRNSGPLFTINGTKSRCKTDKRNWRTGVHRGVCGRKAYISHLPLAQWDYLSYMGNFKLSPNHPSSSLLVTLRAGVCTQIITIPTLP